MLADLSIDKDYEAIRRYLEHRFEVSIPDDCVLHRYGKHEYPKHSHNSKYSWSDESWEMWWKNRLVDAGILKGSGDESKEIKSASFRLHFFFLCIEEDEACMEALRHEPTLKEQFEARSKISSTLEKIQPIDATSKRVTNWKDEDHDP